MTLKSDSRTIELANCAERQVSSRNRSQRHVDQVIMRVLVKRQQFARRPDFDLESVENGDEQETRVFRRKINSSQAQY
jgi:hypothetical protein